MRVLFCMHSPAPLDFQPHIMLSFVRPVPLIVQQRVLLPLFQPHLPLRLHPRVPLCLLLRFPL